MPWAPGEVIKRRGTGLGLHGTCREADSGHRDPARQERPSDAPIQGVGIVHGGRLMPAACEILASARTSKGRWFVVGWVVGWGGLCCGWAGLEGLACLVVVAAFFGDVAGAVLGAGAGP
jgi:hypothetical protein